MVTKTTTLLCSPSHRFLTLLIALLLLQGAISARTLLQEEYSPAVPVPVPAATASGYGDHIYQGDGSSAKGDKSPTTTQQKTVQMSPATAMTQDSYQTDNDGDYPGGYNPGGSYGGYNPGGSYGGYNPGGSYGGYSPGGSYGGYNPGGGYSPSKN
ncbi:unnamed protein product [Linum trigynum]|uniref:Uncharacterized protein n=1 Tax=Linum trigynum TaxID=586398 RepID=A0AAV2F4M7_9ROSI